MNIDRYMVNLFFEIKRNLPYNLREPLKISSPNLGDSMLDVYTSIDNEATKRLIEVFFERAGADWVKKLRSVKGSGSLNFIGSSSDNKQTKAKVKPTIKSEKARYYRGALIAD